MTQHEFETRVKVSVSTEEFKAIEKVYMECDLDKDEFCKVWKRINKSHIARLKAEQAAAEKARQEKAAAIKVLKDLSERIAHWNRPYRFLPCHLTDEEMDALKYVGINPIQLGSNLYWEIYNYLAA